MINLPDKTVQAIVIKYELYCIQRLIKLFDIIKNHTLLRTEHFVTIIRKIIVLKLEKGKIGGL